MSASFSQCWIDAKKPLRDELEQHYQDFLAAGKKPTIGEPQMSAYDFTKKKSQKALNAERRARLGIDDKPKGTQIKTVDDVRKRLQEREAAQ